jgi:hypothetical protein
MPDGIPAPDGVHMLEDGTEVETKDGIIASIKEAIKEGDEVDEQSEGVDGDGGPVIEVEMLEMLKDFVKKMSEKMSNMETKMNAMNAEFKAFKSEPAAKKIADGKTEFNNVSDAADDKVSAIMALRNANKK